MILLCGLGAGFFGTLVGLGGGIIMVPVLNLVFGFPIKTAVATSLCAVCATSIGGAAKYLTRGVADFRMGLFLETTTVIGAVSGCLLAIIVKPQVISIIFALVLFYAAVSIALKKQDAEGNQDNINYNKPTLKRKLSALGLSSVVGMVSSFLGIGGGVVQVPILHLILKLPIKVATATSTYMIGITASAGSLVYFFKGIIDYKFVGPLIIGTLIGSTYGATVAGKLKSTTIKLLFIVVIVYAGLQVGLKGLGVKIL